LTSNIMAGNAPQTPTSSNVGRAGTQQQAAAAQPQVSAEGLMGMIEQLQEHIQRLEGRLAVKSVKIRPPEPFNGTRSKLRGFLTQLDMYIQMNREKLVNEADKVLFATTYLTGPAFDWFEPFVRDYQEHTEDLQDDETKDIFASYAKFKKRLEGTFGDVDKARNAERQLWRLKQVGSVGDYASKFQQIISHLDWDEDMNIAKFEEGLKPEIQEKLIWMERPATLGKMIEQAVKIDNKLQDFHMRRKERSNWSSFYNKRTANYRSNDKRPAQPRNQGYADPYGPQPMELDATQQSALSNEERERRRKERLCFRCGKSGHMSKDCKQQPRKGKHEKQLRATKELSATMDRGAYDTTGIVKPRRRTNELSVTRSNERLRKLYRECTSLSNEEIEQELKMESFTDTEYPEIDWCTADAKELAATNSDDENAVWTDGSNQARAWEKPSPIEPAQVDYPAIDYRAIDPLDEEYGTQWEGPDPSREVPHEAPEIPRDDSPRNDIEADQRVAQILAELQQQQETDRLNQAILKEIEQRVHGCVHWSLDCWYQKKERWEEHVTKCGRHPVYCQQCGRQNVDYHEALKKVSGKKPTGSFHHPCNYDWCICQHYRGHRKHRQVPWIVCYSRDCRTHYDNKYIANYWPEPPRIVQENGNTCPCWRPDCSCIGYRRHPHHQTMHWTSCWEDQCTIHYAAKMNGGYFPDKLSRMREPRWEEKYLAASTQQGQHLKLVACILGQSTAVMVDSGATGNYMHPRFKDQLKILGIKKAQPEPILGLNGENLGTHLLTNESGPVTMIVMGHIEQINFDIVPLGRYDVVLGIPWLRNHNPRINWKTGSLQFTNCNCPRQDRAQGKAGTLRRTRQKGKNEFDAKRLRGKPNMQKKETTTTTTVLAAVAPLQRQLLVDQMGWAPKDDDEYVTTLLPEEVPESSTDEGHRSEGSRELAATSTDQISLPEEHEQYRELFKQSAQCTLPAHGKHDHHIPIQEGKTIACKKLYQMSEKESAALKTYIDEQLSLGKIRPSTSPAGHGVLFVPKKDGGLRLCVDYRPLNAITIKDRYPLPLIHEIQDRIRGAKWFTKLDITDAYNHIRIADGEEWKTAFRTKYGHFEYLVMPFGLTNAPPSFQRFIDEVLRKYLHLFVIAYLDDILVFSEDKNEHVEHVNKVLKELQENNIRLKLSKCEFHVQETEFLGHWISTSGIHVEQNKVRAIRDWPQPRNLKELQQFIGLINYYRRFITGYAKVMQPLFALLKKEAKFEWQGEQEEAFEEVKHRITDAPILVQHDPEKETTIETDASDYAIGMRMTQPGPDGKPRTVAFHSRKLIQAELNYDIHDKELLAIVVAFKVWRVYLEGAKYTITVKTDHKNLTFFTTTKELTRRQARWAETLSQYDFKIVHCKGTENGQADALSRRPDYELQGKTVEPAVLRQNEDGSLTYNHQILAATIELMEDPLIQRIAEATKTDRIIQEMLENSADNENLTTDDRGLIYLRSLIYIPECMRTEIIAKHHDDPMHGHMGAEKTAEAISRNYYFPNMRRKVQGYIHQCETCIRDKPARHQPYGKLQSPEVPTKPWEWITIDFVGPLPKSKGYDYLMTVTDRLTKFIHLVPTTTNMTASQLAGLLMGHVIVSHGMPRYITSDRDKLFTSKFWKSLTDLMGIEQRLTTAYHPQANGQTERTNQTVEQYLRHYVNYQQDDWVVYLPMAQFAYNNAVHSTTGETPFFANYGYNPTLLGEPRNKEPTAEQAKEMVDTVHYMRTQLARDIEFMNFRMAIYYDKRHGSAPDLKKGEKVYLLRRNIKTKRPSQKLDHQKIGPFTIEEKLGPVNYKLRLPKSMSKIHPVFHISLLEPAPKNAMIAEDVEIDDDTEQEYEVERILNDKRVSGKPYYLVKWKGYDTSENTWEPIENLTGCHQLVQRYHQVIRGSTRRKGHATSGSE
jgi:transposase InsO family protein